MSQELLDVLVDGRGLGGGQAEDPVERTHEFGEADDVVVEDRDVAAGL